MFNWLREYLEIRHEYWERKQVCASCEVLRVELGKERREKEMLLQHVLTPTPKEEEIRIAPEPQVPVKAQHVPWRVRQQMLENDSREKARIMKEFQQKDSEIRSQVNPAVTAQSEEFEKIVEGK